MNSGNVLVISHGHPELSIGGGEIAAYNLYKSYKKHFSTQKVIFLARINTNRHPSGQIIKYREDEFLWDQATFDIFKFKATNNLSLYFNFEKFLELYNFTFIHSHHYIHLGIETFKIIKTSLPKSVLFLTFHEYIALCHNHGQLLKHDGTLCTSPSVRNCCQCFPDYSANDFWLRKQFFMYFFSFVDHFISPSNFLANQYIDWGIDSRMLSVIENGQPDIEKISPRVVDGENFFNFGFFGQINKFKGLDIILESLCQLPYSNLKKIHLFINGTGLDNQPKEYQKKIDKFLVLLKDKSHIYLNGKYSQSNLERLMRQIDWVLVPSIWYENSPLVIQEAFSYGRPVVCSDTGGMAEKVDNSSNGVHIPVGSIGSWQVFFTDVLEGKYDWMKLYSNIKKPITHNECLLSHLDLLKNF